MAKHRRRRRVSNEPTPEQPESTPALDPMIAESSRLKREAVRRRKPFDEISVAAELVASKELEGWKVDRILKRVTKMNREKSIDERLENRFWMLMFRLGYPELSEGRKFTVAIERKGAETLRKQVDVLAVDSETVVVAECKASRELTKRSLQKDIEEFANLKGTISDAVKRHYGSERKLKVIFIFVTENIIWSAPDKERAKGQKIGIITERELRYYAQIAEHLGKAARYQFLAEFLRDQQIPELAGKAVPAIRGKLGGKPFYAFVSTPRHLLKISFVNHRSLNDPDGAPSYQRLVNRSRLRSIGDFIKGGGYFPNNLIISFTRKIRFDKVARDDSADVTYGQLYLPDRYRSAWVIDGQHRLYGFSPIDDKYLDQNVIVVAFEQLPKEEEANLFVTINHEQKPVPKHLLDDLEGELKWGSDIPSERIGSISARLINLLNADVGEPFYNRITQQGITSTTRQSLTIPALKDALRRSGLLGRSVFNNTELDFGPLSGSSDSDTLDRARTALNSFFNFIRSGNLIEWERGRDGVLCTNVAVQAYILLLGAVIQYWEANTASDAKDIIVEDVMLAIEEYLKPITDVLEANNAVQLRTRFHVPFGSGGPPEYYYRLCGIIKGKFSDFQPEGMEDWESEQSDEKIQAADRQLKDIVLKVRNYIFDTFRKLYGEKKNAYWENGVIDKAVKSSAYTKSLEYDVDDRLPLESYLELLEMKKIVENKEHWPHFRSVLNIPEPGDKGKAKNLRWMERINDLRRIPAHPAQGRVYKVDDFEYIDFINAELDKRLGESADADPNDVTSESTTDADGDDG